MDSLVSLAVEHAVPLVVGVLLGLLPSALKLALKALRGAAAATPSKLDDEALAAVEAELRKRGLIK